MNLASALNKSIQVKFFDMGVFFIVSLVTYRYFEINERGLLSIFWATFFILELFIIEFGATTQAKIPDLISKKENAKIQNIILSVFFIRSFSAILIGIFIFVFSTQLAMIITPEDIEYIRVDFILKASAIFYVLNILFGPIDHSILIGFKKYKKMRLFYNIKIVPLLVSALLTLSLQKSPEFLLLSYIFIRLLLQIIMGWHSYNHLKKEGDFKFIRETNFDKDIAIDIAKHGLPIWISSLLAASTPHIAILILGQNSSLDIVAQYSLAMSLFMAAIAFLAMLDGWLVPKLSEIKSKKIQHVFKYVNEYYDFYFYISSIFGVLIMIFSDLGVKIIAGSGYENSAILLVAFCCFINFRTLSIFRNVIVVFKSTTVIPIYVFYKFLIEITIMAILVPQLSYYGILLAQFIAYLLVGQLWIARVFYSVFNKKSIKIFFYNRYFKVCLLTSFLSCISLYLFVTKSFLFYIYCAVYLSILTSLVIKHFHQFKKILST